MFARFLTASRSSLQSTEPTDGTSLSTENAVVPVGPAPNPVRYPDSSFVLGSIVICNKKAVK